MIPCTTIDKQALQHILTRLKELASLYRSDSLTEYEQTLQTVAKLAHQTLPGFTVAYTEIHTKGEQRNPHGGMRYVLLPQQERSGQ